MLAYFLGKCDIKEPSTSTLTRLAELVLTLNSFFFNNEYYRQLGGVAMGSRMGPNYACLFVGYVVHHKKETSTTLGQPHARGRNSKPLLTSFLTSTSSITETELPFLDINLCISEDRIQTSVFYKETYTHKYLHFSCFHPDHCMRAICTAPEMIPTPK